MKNPDSFSLLKGSVLFLLGKGVSLLGKVFRCFGKKCFPLVVKRYPVSFLPANASRRSLWEGGGGSWQLDVGRALSFVSSAR